MIECEGDMFEDYLDPGIWYVITTNGYVKNNGEAVMGAGTAKYARGLHPDLSHILGDFILSHGNVPFILPYGFVSLPVKHHWKEKADIDLIDRSLRTMRILWDTYKDKRRQIYLPRPGCGNGGLSWYHVRPLVENYFGNDDDVVVWSLEE